jgi:multimeric flavodoxin WrbA
LRALVLDGSLAGDESLAMPREILTAELGYRGWTVEAAILRDLQIADCAGCYGCWIKTPGTCVVNDAGRDVARLAVQSDLVVLLTAVTFGGYSSELKKAVERMIPILSPFFEKVGGEMHHAGRYRDYARILAVGMAREPDDERDRIFRTLVERNAINMRAPAQAAGVMLTTWTGDQVRETIGRLLVGVGVTV